MWAYGLLRAFLRIAVRVFCRQVEVVGLENVPPEGEGSVLFAERAALEAEILRAVDRVRPAEMELLYPHGAPSGGPS